MTKTPEELNWGRVGTGLTTLHRFLQAYVCTELKTFFHTIPRIEDPGNPFSGCLSDSHGNPLRSHGNGVQLSYKSLPRYDKSLLGKNEPIIISSEHELAYLYISEYYKKENAHCYISNLDVSAILFILSKAPCFPNNIKIQAAKIRDGVRNKWAHAIITNWTSTVMTSAFSELKIMAQMMPDNGRLLNELEEDRTGAKTAEFPMEEKANKYRTWVVNRQHEKIEEKIKRLANSHGREIYLERTFRKRGGTKQKTANIEKLVLEEETVLLKGEAGAGKSSIAAKALQDWAKQNHMSVITCFLHLSAGSDEKIPLNRIIWDEYSDVMHWSDKEAKEVFCYLQHLAIQGELAIIIDGLDELGTMTHHDISTASRAANYSDLLVDMKTACVGILAQKILPGAKVLATGRYTELANNEVLKKNPAILYEIVDLTEEDRGKLVKMMEQDPDEIRRIQWELDRVATTGNSYFLRTPLMTKNIIQLIIERKVDIEMTKNSSDIYLMMLMKNLDFHTDQYTSFTELAPPEYQDYLVMCLKLCQYIMQNIESINSIRGISTINKEKGQCFEIDVLDETLQIPFDFIKKLGIFDCRKEGGGLAYLDLVHLSYMEFCCAASLCQNGLDIQHELSKIKSHERYEAVLIYLAGMFARESRIDFLNTCKNLCQNFLYLLHNKQRDKSVQDIFKSILRRPLQKVKERMEITFITTSLEEYTMSSRTMKLLTVAMAAAEDKINNFNLNKVELRLKRDWNVDLLAKFIELQQSTIEYLFIYGSLYLSTDSYDMQMKILMKILKVSTNWELRKLSLRGYYQGLSLFPIAGQRLDFMHVGTVVTERTDMDTQMQILCLLLETTQEWRIDNLYVSYYNNFSATTSSMLAGWTQHGRLRSIHV